MLVLNIEMIFRLRLAMTLHLFTEPREQTDVCVSECHLHSGMLQGKTGDNSCVLVCFLKEYLIKPIQQIQIYRAQIVLVIKIIWRV